SVSGVPVGASATLSPSSVTAPGSSRLAVSTSAATVPGTYTLTITGTSGSSAHSTVVTLVVTPPGSLTVPPLPLPPLPPVTTPPAAPVPGGAQLVVSTSAATPPGTYTLTLTGSSGGISHSVSLMLVVNTPS